MPFGRRIGVFEIGLCRASAKVGAAQIYMLSCLVCRPIRRGATDKGAVQRGETPALLSRSWRGSVACFASQSVRWQLR